MAFYTQIFLIFAISFFLTTLPSKAYKNYPTPSQSHAPALSPQGSSTSTSTSSSSSSSSSTAALSSVSASASTAASSSVSASASTSASSLSTVAASVNSATTFEIPKNIPVVTTGDVSIFVKAIMDATMSKTDEFIRKVIEKRLAEPKTDIYAKDCLETCKSVFEDAKDAMKRTEEDVKAGNMYKANVDVSAISTNIDTCNECATSIYGFDPEFNKFDNWAQGIASDCLDKITGQSS